MIIYEFAELLLCLLVAIIVLYFYVKRSYFRGNKEHINLPENDEFIYSKEGGKMTLEQAENDYALINPDLNEDGLPYMKVQTSTHEESVDRIYENLSAETKRKLNKDILCGLIGVIEDRTYPDMILSDAILDDIHVYLQKKHLCLTKEEIMLIWGS